MFNHTNNVTKRGAVVVSSLACETESGAVCMCYTAIVIVAIVVVRPSAASTLMSALVMAFFFFRLEENYEFTEGVCIPHSTLYVHMYTL